jgi:DNA-binding response OmpR family regulator
MIRIMGAPEWLLDYLLRALEARAKDFIGKPLDLAELKARVRTFGGRHHL